MDERVKFIIVGVGLMLFAVSPPFCGVSAYNTVWQNPEEPTLIEAALDYFDDAQYGITHPGLTQLIWIIGFALFFVAVGMNRGKKIYGS